MKQHIDIGIGSFKKINKYLGNKDRNILIVSTKSCLQRNSIPQFLSRLKVQRNYFFFSDFTPNPKYLDAVKGAKLFVKESCDLIIAIGGGSTIDIAKLINAAQSDLKNFKQIATGKKKLNKKIKKLIAIPTTAGTGSESTHFAVVYIREKKYSLAANILLPNIAIIDPVLAYKVPKYLAASCAFDALTQSIESYWSIKSSKKSRALSIKSIKLILGNLNKSINLKDKNSIKKIMVAANLSGQAINITKTTAPHALSYKISDLAKISHGHAVAITLGYFFEINHFSKKMNGNYSSKSLAKIMNEIYHLLGVTNAVEAKSKWLSLMKMCSLETETRKIGIKNKVVANKIVSSINIERLNNHPVMPTKQELNKIFQ